MRRARVLVQATFWFCFFFKPIQIRAKPVEFNLPAQSAANALLAFSQQAKIEVLFSFDQLREVQSVEVRGSYEPENAIVHLLGGTGFITRRDPKGKFVVTPVLRTTGSVTGRLLKPDGQGARGLRVTIIETSQSTKTDLKGEFRFDSVLPGAYRVIAIGEGYQRLQVDHVAVEAGRAIALETQMLQKSEDLTRFDPYIVQGRGEPPRPFGRSRDALPPRTATGNIDLPRTENDALPYAIYDREQIIRSGVVGLNEFLQRSVLESDGATPAPEQAGSQIPRGSDLQLRGFASDETVVLVNGRRLPEVLTSGKTRTLGPDVNFIPLSLIQQVEVLPVSASALYSGNAVGGVINIVLRPDLEANEVTATYTNAVGGFDAPQSSISFLHGQALLGGRLHLRLNANFTHSTPPAESELGFHQAHPRNTMPLDQPVYRATPNIRSADNTPLFGPGTSSVTSVVPGSDGIASLAEFANRNGVRNFAYFDAPGSLNASFDSLDYAYGRRQRRAAYFGSIIYDVFPWLQFGLDGTYVTTAVNRGYDVLAADLDLKAGSLFNPFDRDIKVSLNEISPLLDENYSEAQLELSSIAMGALVKLPADWQLSFDTQYARNITRYRGLTLPDAELWQQLVDQGLYNPLRDTQIGSPPAEFYDRVLVYYGRRGDFVTLGKYDTLDAAMRITNRKLSLPTGLAAVNFGADYRRSHIDPYTEERRFGGGSLAQDPVQWTGRTLQRYSAFGELQAPLVPSRWLPNWIKAVEADLAVRYVAADTAAETNVAPTIALKAELLNGFTLRGSLTTSNRFPTPQLSRKIDRPTGGTGGTGSDTLVNIEDPRRGRENYYAVTKEILNADLSTEGSITQTVGAFWQRGKTHRLRVAVDFVDTRKVNEIGDLSTPKAILDLESIFPERVSRAPLQPGDTQDAGRVTTLLTGAVNLASRHSQNWNTSLDYLWTECWGGAFEVYGRWLYFQRYDRELSPGSGLVDELDHPDGTASSLLRHRVNFGTAWSTPKFGVGIDGHYFNSRILPVGEWTAEGGTRIKPYWQFDVYLQGELSQWLPWKSSRYGLRGQLRINNISGFDYPKYVYDASQAGVQPYGDWRGRTYSISITATF